MLTQIVKPEYIPPTLPCLTTDEARTSANAARRELAEAEAELARFQTYNELTASAEQSEREILERVSALRAEKAALEAELADAVAMAERQAATRAAALVQQQRAHGRFVSREEEHAAPPTVMS